MYFTAGLHCFLLLTPGSPLAGGEKPPFAMTGGGSGISCRGSAVTDSGPSHSHSWAHATSLPALGHCHPSPALPGACHPCTLLPARCTSACHTSHKPFSETRPPSRLICHQQAEPRAGPRGSPRDGDSRAPFKSRVESSPPSSRCCKLPLITPPRPEGPLALSASHS